MFIGATDSNSSPNCFLVGSGSPSMATVSSLSSSRVPTPSTNLRKRSFLATKSVSQLTSSSRALVLHSLRKEATTPSLVYFYERFSAEASPLTLSHSMAFSWSQWLYSRAFLHSPMGALVSSRSRLMASIGTLAVENHLRAKLTNILINIILDNKPLCTLLLAANTPL